MTQTISYERSLCKGCGFNVGYMPCCGKIYCEKYGLTDARSSCESYEPES